MRRQREGREGERPAPLATSGDRCLAQLIDCAAAAWVLRNPHRQTLHHRLVRTYVVQAEPGAFERRAPDT